MAANYSIKLDVLRALISERHGRILSQIYAEEAKPEPDVVAIAELDEQRFELPNWGNFPEEEQIDAVIEKWKAVINEQRQTRS